MAQIVRYAVPRDNRLWPGPGEVVVGGADGTPNKVSFMRSWSHLTVASADASDAARKRADLVCDGTDDDAEIMTAHDAIWQNGAGSGRVQLTSGPFVVGASMKLQARMRLYGESTAPADQGGTVLQAKNGLNADVLQTMGIDTDTSWWHGGELAYLRIDGNKANNTSGIGANIGKMGETAAVRFVLVQNCAGSGVRLEKNSTPSNLIGVTSNGNGAYGFDLDQISAHVSLINPSGDGNTLGVLRINGYAAFPVGHVHIIGLKAEQNADLVALIDDYAGPIVFLGGNMSAASAKTTAIKRIGANGWTGDATFLGTRFYNFTNQFEDTLNTANTISRGTAAVSITAHVGDWSGDLVLRKHLIARTGPTPTFSTFGAAGTGATCVGAGTPTDTKGVISLTTGTSPATGTLARMTFNQAFAATPRTFITPQNAAAAALSGTQQVVASNNTGTTWEIVSGSAALAPSTNYQWNYLVVG